MVFLTSNSVALFLSVVEEALPPPKKNWLIPAAGSFVSPEPLGNTEET
jgi:hypothetical protein